MKATILRATLVSTVLVSPFVYLELRNATQNHSRFPYVLFTILWLLPAASILAGAPMIRAMRAGENLLVRPGLLMGRVVVVVVAALFWTALVHDQMPCFIGTPDCD